MADAYVCVGAGILFLNGIFNPEKNVKKNSAA
jgi:lipoprotein signal peptidase